VLGIRPESFEDAAFAPGLPTLDVRVRCSRSSARTPTFLPRRCGAGHGEVLEAHDEGLLPADQALFTARVDARTAARVGGTLQLAVDPARFHFFDPETGNRLGAEAPALAMA
jgi:ABC-type sugar transport systems, ATPase components